MALNYKRSLPQPFRDSPASTAELAEKLKDASFSRRHLLKATGLGAGLAVVWTSPIRAQDATPAATPAGGLPSASNLVDNYNPPPTGGFLQPGDQVDAYLAIDAEGKVTLRTGLTEFGQGIETGFIQIAAEELGVAFEDITAVLGKTDEVPYNLSTFGSLSTQFTGPIIRNAAATMHDWLLDLGAEHFSVDKDLLTADGGQVFVTSDTTQTVSYGELAGGQASSRAIDTAIATKDPADYKIVGQPIPRVHAREKVTGELKFGMDAIMEGMVFAAIVRPPSLGATLESIDFSEAEKAPGFVDSFHDGNFAAIGATRFEYARAAVQLVKATWKELNTGNSSTTIHDLIRQTADAGTPLGTDEETEGTPSAATPVPAEIVQPLNLTIKDAYVNHAPIEPKNALVNVTPEKVEVWATTQSPFSVQAAVATQLGRDASEVVVHALYSGGGFGSKITPNPEMPAAVLSTVWGKPVKLIWTREEEFQYSQYRPAMTVDVATGLDAEGKIASWTYDAYTAGYYPETADYVSGSASDWGADVKEIYAIPGVETTLYNGHSPLPPYYWRVNGASTNAFARETAITMLAEMAGQDPVSFRRPMLSNDNKRMEAVMDAVVEQSGYTPTVGPSGQGYGLALAFDANSFLAQVAKVNVDTSTGQIVVERVDCVIDCGLAVNPEAIRHQVEGSINLSLSTAIKEAIVFESGKVLNPTFDQYNPLRITEAPREIVVGVMDNKTEPMAGVGEPAVAPVPAVIAAAVYDQTGVWMTELPMTPDKVLAALQAAGKATSATPEA